MTNEEFLKNEDLTCMHWEKDDDTVTDHDMSVVLENAISALRRAQKRIRELTTLAGSNKCLGPRQLELSNAIIDLCSIARLSLFSALTESHARECS